MRGNGKIGAFEKREMTNGVRYDVADLQVRWGRTARPGGAGDFVRFRERDTGLVRSGGPGGRGR